jgi:rubrerythrin
MASFVNAADVLAAAVEIEHRGITFYKEQADRASNAEVKEFFTFLAAEEVKHEKIFDAMLKRIGGLDLPVSSSTQEYLDYVSSSLDSHMLFIKDQAVVDNTNPYLLALRLEKDTIVYFLAMSDLVPESEKKQVQHCITEELHHIALIQQKKHASER